ncbi:MAG: Lrp/AsnC family transcriptional regulator [Candidatus Bathyarchaeota archaeon]|jgi:DNA-binding Lrp family transcriptional regulator|nr:Lrp/AsnC family transcriptional regulator [Candidatus Bathyarchaeota archaeon]
MLKIQELDKKILLQLLKDGRQTFLNIATQIGASRQTVAKKIKQYLNSGVITKFTPQLDPGQLGLTIQAYILVREDPQTNFRTRNDDTFTRMPQVAKFNRIFGSYSSILEVMVKDKNELTEIVKKIHALPGIRETETFIVYNTIKDDHSDPFRHILT